MGRYLTEQGFANMRAAAGRGRARRRRWRAPCAGGRTRFHPQPGRRLDVDARSADARPGGSDGGHRGGAGDRSRTARGLRRDRHAAWPSPRRDARGAGTRHRRSGVRAGARRVPTSRRNGPSRPSSSLPRPSPRSMAQSEWDGRGRAGPCRRDGGARQRSARRSARSPQTGARHDADAHPRRSASRAGAGRERRCLHHRLRGRAGEADGAAAAQRTTGCATSPACSARSTMRPR